MGTKYECYFIFDGEMCSTSSCCIADFREGFWVTSELQFTKYDDCKYWMPPSSIDHIEKVRDGHGC